MPGPPPKNPADRRRRNATVPMTQLPSGGRSGPVPEWPYARQSVAEARWWERFWSKPHAAAWERNHLHEVVARYCRVFARAEDPEAPAPLLAECRNLEDRLGLNPVAMLKLRWEVAADEVAERRAARADEWPEAVDPKAVEK